MAIFIPESPAHRTSSAELWLFNKLRELDDRYYVLHSLGLIRHSNKNWSEIDFVVLGPEGIFFIEVKGGIVGRVQGVWQVIGADGKQSFLGRGPFFQAGGAEAGARKFLESRLNWVKDYTTGFCVFTPECRINVDDLGIVKSVYFDADDAFRHSSEYIDVLCKYWAEKTGRNKTLSQQQIEMIIPFLCSDIPILKAAPKVADDIQIQVVASSDKQKEILGYLNYSKKIIFEGGAASGLPALAEAEVVSLLRENLRVLLLTESDEVAQYFSNRISKGQDFKIKTLESLAMQSQKEEASHDVLIVFEGTEVFSPENIQFLDKLLMQVALNGKWRIFIDPVRKEFQGLSDSIERIKVALQPAIVVLPDNFLTSGPNLALTQSLIGISLLTSSIDGPTSDLEFFSDSDEVIRKVLKRLEELVNRGYTEDEIVVLTNKALRDSCLASISDLFEDFWATTEDRKTVKRWRHSEISNIQIFPIRCVLVVDFDFSENSLHKEMIYLACTRAQINLSLFFKEEFRSSIVRALIPK
jgi:hypothetical protein